MASALRIPTTVAATVIVLFLSLLLLQVGDAYADDEVSPITITYDDKLVYCSVERISISDRAILALNQGTPVTFVWKISIEESRDYWIDKNIGEVTIARQAIPDLISKSLVIADAKNGISRRVHTIDDAIDFLSELNRFPIIDRSLLEKGKRYNIGVEFHIQEGQFSDTWWSEATRINTDIAEEEIELP